MCSPSSCSAIPKKDVLGAPGIAKPQSRERLYYVPSSSSPPGHADFTLHGRRFDSVFLAGSFSNSVFPFDGDRVFLVVPFVVKPQLNLNADRVEQKLDLVLGLVV